MLFAVVLILCLLPYFYFASVLLSHRRVLLKFAPYDYIISFKICDFINIACDKRVVFTLFFIFVDYDFVRSKNIKINLTISILSLLGATGFIVLDDVYRSINSRKWNMTLTTRIILVSTFGAIAIGTILLFFDANIAELPLKERTLVAFFQTITTLTTAGFHTFPTVKLTAATTMVVIILMILGASPSGTGGGLKSTTWSAAIATILSFLHGRDEITFFGYKVPHGRITAAFATFALYLIAFSAGTYCLLLFDVHSFEASAFEIAAALGTVGLSRGITTDLSVGGKIVIIVIMFIGRLGVVSLALGAVAFYQDISHENQEPPPEKTDDIVL